MPHSIKLITHHGLEAVMRREVSQIVPGLSSTSCVTPRAVSLTFFGATGELSSNPVDRTLATLSLRSGIMTGIRVQVGAGFSAEWENQIREGLPKLQWNLFLPKSTTAGDLQISVKSHKSRLLSAPHVRDIAREVLLNELPNPSTHSSAGVAWGTQCSPKICIDLNDNVMRVYIEAVGSEASWCLESFPADSRIRIGSAVAHSVYHRALRGVLDRCDFRFKLWDPFTSDGGLALTLAKAITGVPAGSPAYPYPFRLFPMHNPTVFAGVANELVCQPHARIDLIESSVLSDSSIEAINISKTNMEAFKKSLPQVDSGDVIPFPIDIVRFPDAYSPPEGRLVIVTALPIKGDTQRKYKKFHDMVDKLMQDKRLAGCIVLTSKPVEFRRLSQRSWLTELRFFYGGRFVETLRLVDS